MNSIFLLINALKAGNELSNAETWKNRQAASALVMAVLAAIVGVAGAFGFRPSLDSADLQSIAGGVVAAFGMFNAYLSVATSKRVGVRTDEVPPGGEPDPGAVAYEDDRSPGGS